MTSQKPTGTSPFALTYGMEAITPTEIRMPTLRTEIPEEANVEVVTKDLYSCAYSIILAETEKPVQQVGKVAYILRRRPALEKSLLKHN